MGQFRRKKQRFFAADPVCCFCEGKNKTTTIDHVPPMPRFMVAKRPRALNSLLALNANLQRGWMRFPSL